MRLTYPLFPEYYIQCPRTHDSMRSKLVKYAQKVITFSAKKYEAPPNHTAPISLDFVNEYLVRFKEKKYLSPADIANMQPEQLCALYNHIALLYHLFSLATEMEIAEFNNELFS